MSPARSEGTILLFGGDGSEHRVSTSSGQNLAGILQGVELWYWSRSDAVHLVELGELLALERPFEEDLSPSSPPRWRQLREALDAPEARGKVFLLALHGGSGEDGTVQSWLEARKLPFTGSGSAASRLAFDKVGARDAVSRCGAQVAPAEVVRGGDRNATRERMHRSFELFGKLVLKPVADGSSHGMRFLESEADLEEAAGWLECVPREPYLLERFIEGAELTVGVVQEERGAVALPCTEVRVEPGRRFDYEGKYLGKGSEELTPAPVPDEIARAAQRLALTAHEAVGCEGYSRTDLIANEDGPVFLEINTLPGLTKASFIPQQLEAAGISMLRFLEAQIALARRPYRRHSGKIVPAGIAGK